MLFITLIKSSVTGAFSPRSRSSGTASAPSTYEITIIRTSAAITRASSAPVSAGGSDMTELRIVHEMNTFITSLLSPLAKSGLNALRRAPM